MLDKEAVVEIVVSRDTRAKEAESSEAEVRMPGEARTRAEDARDGLGKRRIREDKVLRAEGVVGDEEAQKVAEMGEKRDLGGRHGERRICEERWVSSRRASRANRSAHLLKIGRANRLEAERATERSGRRRTGGTSPPPGPPDAS